MRLGLISPKRGRLIGHRELEKFFWSSEELRKRAEIIYKWPELGLLTIGALTPAEIEIQYLDEEVESIDFDTPFDLVGMTAITPKASRAYVIAREFRKRGVYTVMGGPHASVMPEEAKQHVDTVFVGEAEENWPKFLEEFQRGHPRPIYSTEGGTVDLTVSPVPLYHLLRPEKYRIIPLETTRGCPHDCEFCSTTRLFGRRYRKKTILQVVQNIEAILGVAPGKFLFFVDDNMFVDRRHAKELLRAITPYKIRWFTQSDISIAEDDELLDLMFAAGCREVLIGFETLSPDNLRNLNPDHWKLRQLEKYPWAIERIQSRGIAIYGSIVIGMDDDDATVFSQLKRFVDDTQLLGFQILMLTPIPGTRLFVRLKEEGRLYKNRPWGDHSTYKVNFRPKRMSRREMEEGMLWLFRELYSEDAFRKRKQHYLNLLRRRQPSSFTTDPSSAEKTPHVPVTES